MKDSELVRILDKYKCNKIIDNEDQNVIDTLSMAGFIKIGYIFDRKTFLSSKTATTTQLGNEVMEYRK